MMDKAEADDDITYSVLGLMMLEQHMELKLNTDDVARSWINLLPVGSNFYRRARMLI